MVWCPRFLSPSPNILSVSRRVPTHVTGPQNGLHLLLRVTFAAWSREKARGQGSQRPSALLQVTTSSEQAVCLESESSHYFSLKDGEPRRIFYGRCLLRDVLQRLGLSVSVHELTAEAGNRPQLYKAQE